MKSDQFRKFDDPRQEETILSSKISPDESGRTLIDFLSGRFRYHAAPEWNSIIRSGSVTVNGAGAAPDLVLNTHDIVAYHVVLREPPVDTNFSIIAEEDGFIVANKTGNLPSHADGNFIKHTFIYLLRERLSGTGYHGTVKLVNRLDRETSGLIIASKDIEVHKNLTRQFESGSIGKEYLAVARGTVPGDGFEVSGAIGFDRTSRISIRRTVVPEGTPGSKPSRTVFRVMERLGNFTVLLCLPRTGRTNQIRVHLAHAGHPLAGDKLYGRTDGEFLEFVRRARDGDFPHLPWLESPRHLLHSYRIAFDHPRSGKRMQFEAPVPEDMMQFIKTQSHA